MFRTPRKTAWLYLEYCVQFWSPHAGRHVQALKSLGTDYQKQPAEGRILHSTSKTMLECPCSGRGGVWLQTSTKDTKQEEQNSNEQNSGSCCLCVAKQTCMWRNWLEEKLPLPPLVGKITKAGASLELTAAEITNRNKKHRCSMIWLSKPAHVFCL